MKNYNINNFKNKKILFGVKEAGAGSLLAELIKNIKPNKQSLVLSSSIASIYFEEIDIEVKIIDKEISNKKIGDTIDLLSPDYVLVGASAYKSIEKQLITESKVRNYKVVSFIDHYWNLWQRYANEKNAEPWAYKPDFIFVIDEICKIKLCELGWPKDKIGINPYSLKNKTNFEKIISSKKINKKLNIEDNSIKILFVSEYNFPQCEIWKWEQSSNEEIDFLLKSILDFIDSFNRINQNQFQLIIKLHPSEDNRLSKTYKNYSENNYCVVKNQLEKVELFTISDLVVGLNSMLLLEASSFGLSVYSYSGSLQKSAIRLNEIDKRINSINNFSCFENKLNKF